MRDIKILRDGIRPFLQGFLSGAFILFLCYSVIFLITGQDFTFSYIADFHEKSAYIFFLDIIPFAGGLLAYFIFLKNKRVKDELRELIVKERERKEQAITFLNSLKGGRFTNIMKGEPANELINSLNELRQTLQKNKEAEELRIKEDTQRNWVSEGLAMFSQILRQSTDNREDFAYLLISKLVKYMEANQGGFFSVETDQNSGTYLQMLACHAYDRRKFADRRIEWGTGLIGTCALEKKTIYLTKIPNDYLYVTSGLGKAPPGYLMLLPLSTGGEIQGVIEIASFRRIEDYQIAFCEKIAESIGMTMSGIKSNLRTSLLLDETRAQARELSNQEEKMRQSMDQLKATQEQAARQAEKFISFTNSVNHTLIRAEYDIEGILLYANTKFLRKMGFSGNREVEGKHISTFIHEKEREWFAAIWEGLSTGGEHFEGYMKHITKQGQDIWTMATYTCVRKEDGSVEKVLFLAIDTTEYKKQSLDYEGQIEAINKLSLKAEFMPDGKLKSTNELFKNALKYPPQDLELKSIFDFLDRRDIENFMDIWEEVIKGNAYQGQLRLITRINEEKWFRSTFTSVNDMYGEVSKVVFLANEITNERIMELESRKQTEQLKIHEEKLRIAGIELVRKMEEAEIKWKEKIRNIEDRLHLSEKIIDLLNTLIISVDNSGNLVYLNDQACKYWKLKRKEVIGQPAFLVFDTMNNQYPAFFMDFIDPGKPKAESEHPLVIPGAQNMSESFITKLYTLEQNEKIIYSLFLNKIKCIK